MEFWISQICGLIVSGAGIASMQWKSIKGVLVCQIICNGVGALSYILLGGLSGCGIFITALAQTIVYFLFRVKNKKAPLPVTILFVALYILCSASTYRTPIDLLSAAAALTCAIGLAQEKPAAYRLFMLANGLLWLAYDFNVGAYGMIVTHVAAAVSAMIGILRLDLKKKDSAAKGT